MEIAEIHKHRIRAQLIKIIGHLREARVALNYSQDNVKVVKNAQDIKEIATLQLDTASIPTRIEAVSDEIEKVISHLVSQAEILRSSMDNPNNRPPPIVGRFLSLAGLTTMQRQMARDGSLPYSDTPTHYPIIDPNRQDPPPTPKPLPKVLIIKRKPRRKKRNEMPI